MRSIRYFCIDLLLVLAASMGALLLRHDFYWATDRILLFIPYCGLTVACAATCFLITGLHKAIWRFTSLADCVRIVIAAVTTVLSTMAVGFLLNRLEHVTRAIPVLQVMLIIGAMTGARAMVRLRQRGLSQPLPSLGEGEFAAPMPEALIVGLNSTTELYLRSIAENGWKASIAGVLERGGQHVGQSLRSLKVLGVPDDVRSVLRELSIEGRHVDRIILTMPWHKLSPIAQAELQDLADNEGILVVQIADQIGAAISGSRADARQLDPVRVAFNLDATELTAPETRSYWNAKRLFDFVLAATLLVGLAPFMLLIAAAVRFDVGANVLFRQQRPGLRGRQFNVIKFRTMSSAFDRNGARLDEPSRCSAFGNFLRRTRFDELPQLFNVLTGEMSFVGPRPLLPIDQAPEYRARLLVRPGLTGWAQVEGGRHVTALDKAVMDVWYVRNASMGLDLKIMAKTVPILLFGERVNRSSIERAWRELTAAGICTERRPNLAFGGNDAIKR